MSTPRARVFASLARTQFRRQTPHVQSFGARRAYSMAEVQALPGKVVESMKGDWPRQGRRIVNGLQLYVPIVACLMFWPYAVAPIMTLAQTNL
ncbi:hypothetical protein VTL71DRAFT_3566 [Oculimacula yallundae]|uniref:Uncharacterized protein n=1 Tax=Oculimacula yallundae TaxID=86028 RepID=A0ABR4C9E6_9HELO